MKEVIGEWEGPVPEGEPIYNANEICWNCPTCGQKWTSFRTFIRHNAIRSKCDVCGERVRVVFEEVTDDDD